MRARQHVPRFTAKVVGVASTRVRSKRTRGAARSGKDLEAFVVILGLSASCAAVLEMKSTYNGVLFIGTMITTLCGYTSQNYTPKMIPSYLNIICCCSASAEEGNTSDPQDLVTVSPLMPPLPSSRLSLSQSSWVSAVFQDS